MLNYLSGELNHGENDDNTIKDSRKTRIKKLAKNKFYHRKNPKSVAYYKRQTINEKIIPLNIKNELTNEQLNKLTADEMEKKMSLYHKEQYETTKTLPDNVININTDLTANYQQNVKDINKPYKNKEYNQSKQYKQGVKNKNVLEGLCSSLEKTFKREGVFLEFNSSKGLVTAMKDYPTQLHIGKMKCVLALRCVLGDFELKQVANNHNNTFAPIKKDFAHWLHLKITNFKPDDCFYNFYNPLLDTINKDTVLLKHLPNLQSKIITALKKSSKQPHGFVHRIEQIVTLWSEEAKEVYYIEQVESQLHFKSFEQSFPLARSMKRKFSIYVGKTNSGKTYTAMNALAQASSGAYLAPLRLMAQEGQDALYDRKIVSNLVTGEEQKRFDGATHVSSTVEMCNMTRPIDVAVIDEIQMIADDSRGWAWSQALVGVPAKHVILVGSEESLPFILPIIDSLGETYEIQRFERKTPLNIHDGLKKFKELKAGDCVVVFSRKSALEMKNAIESSGKKCSVIYGNLSPDVRRLEANKFRSGENPILVATDAIGMGLNLPINRLFFSTLEKFDGIESRYLTISEIKQIAGRAGRYGFSEFGEVGLLMNDNHTDRTLLHKSIYGAYEQTDDTRVPIAPNLQQIQTICKTLGKDDLYAALIFFKEKMVKNHSLYKTANLEDMIEISFLLRNKNLDLATGLNYACVPIDTNSEIHMKNFFRWINAHTNGKEVPSPLLPDVVELEKNDSYSLYEAENYVKLCMSYRWLHYKYPDNYVDIENVIDNARTTNSYIEKTLHHHVVISKNPRWKR